MIILDLIAWIVFLFLTYYILIRLYIISCSSKGKILEIEKRNYVNKFQQNINIIIYSHNNTDTILELIEALRKQEYDPDKYLINIILDNCSDDSAKVLEILGGTRLWRINTDIGPIGRNKSIAWLLERILTSENTNAFVFINADCLVKPDFLLQINNAIYDNPVIAGEILPVNSKLNFMSTLICFKNKIQNKILKQGRHCASLSNILDENIWAVRQDILEKINFSITDNGFEEYEFSLKLAKAGIPIVNIPAFQCYKPMLENFKNIVLESYKTKYKRFITLKNNIPNLFNKSDFRAKELILSLFYPSGTTFILLTIMLAIFSIKENSLFIHTIKIKSIIILDFGYLLTEFLAILFARCSFEEYKSGILWIFIAPSVFIFSLFRGINLNISFKLTLPKNLLTNNKIADKQIIETTVTDGKKELPCRLELKQFDNYSQVIFKFNEKNLTSLKHSRIDLALEEIVKKLDSHGFTLKVCLNCSYFKLNESMAQKFNGEQGYCLFDNITKNYKAMEYSYIWNCCKNIISDKNVASKFL